MLHELNGAVALAVQVTLQFHPVFNTLSSAKREQFLRDEIAANRLSEYQANELRTADTDQERQTLYKQFTHSRNLDDAAEKQRLFNNYMIKNRIFMSDELRNAFEDAHTVLHSAMAGYSIGTDAGTVTDRQLVRKAMLSMNPEEMERRLNLIEHTIKKRLRYAEAD